MNCSPMAVVFLGHGEEILHLTGHLRSWASASSISSSGAENSLRTASMAGICTGRPGPEDIHHHQRVPALFDRLA